MLDFSKRLGDLHIDAATSFEEANLRLEQAGLADGLPMVPPTPERIDAMLAGWRVKPEMRLAAPLMPSSIHPSVRDIAVNAVLAGCRREYLPVLTAAVAAMTDPTFDLLGVQATTGSAAPLVVVSGPVAEELGISGGANCMGQGHRANATIGRAVRLVLQNLGGSVPGVNDMATLGQPGKYGWCFAENQAESPFPPFHIDAGFPADSSAVTVMAVTGSLEVVLPANGPAEDARRLGEALRRRRGDSQTMVVLPPETANVSKTQEWDRRRWQQAIIEAQDAESAAEGSLDSILVMVAGGVGIKAAVMPGWAASKAVTRLVKAL